jgi:hypothetical protein
LSAKRFLFFHEGQRTVSRDDQWRWLAPIIPCPRHIWATESGRVGRHSYPARAEAL